MAPSLPGPFLALNKLLGHTGQHAESGRQESTIPCYNAGCADLIQLAGRDRNTAKPEVLRCPPIPLGSAAHVPGMS